MSKWQYREPPALSDAQYQRWQDLLEQRAGICFLQHKSILQKGLVQRMREIGCDDYEAYYAQVSKVPDGVVEWTLLVDRMSVKESSFFRDAAAFALIERYLNQRVQWLQERGQQTLDIWSVGCSTGEEPYSLAMVAADQIEQLQAPLFLGVLATDISQSALSIGRAGHYRERKLERIGAQRIDKYFRRRAEDDYEIVAPLRERVCYTQGNILELDKVPDIRMDVIYCQNVLIYFRRERVAAVMDQFARQLKPGGLLVIGPGECVGWKHPALQRSKDSMVQAYIRHVAD